MCVIFMRMPSKYTKENLEPIVTSSSSWAEVCRKLGVKDSCGGQTYVTKVSKSLGMDFSHFTGQAWNRGKIHPVKDITKYLVKGSMINSHKLKLKLIKTGLKNYECEICKLTEWNGEPIVLELDHINSEHRDNRLENLQIICSNCHATETRKRIKVRKARVVQRQETYPLEG